MNNTILDKDRFFLREEGAQCFLEITGDKSQSSIKQACLSGRSIEVLGYYLDCDSLVRAINQLANVAELYGEESNDQSLFAGSVLTSDAPGRRVQMHLYRLLLGAWDLDEDELPFRALDAGRHDVALALVRAGCVVMGVDEEGKTLVHRAVEAGDKELVQSLFERGVLLNQEDELGWTPFDLAIEGGHDQIALDLIEHGCLETADEWFLERSLRNWFETMLHYQNPAEPWRHKTEEAENIIKEIFNSMGAQFVRDHSKLFEKFTITALDHYHSGIVSHLVKMGLKLDLHKKLDYQQTFLHTFIEMASEVGQNELDTVEAFLDQGADVGSLDETHKTPLHFAATSGEPKLIHLLVDRGASVDSVDEEGNPPLHKAVTYTPLGCAHALVERGAQISSIPKDYLGSVFHRAVQEDREYLVEKLYEVDPSLLRDESFQEETPIRVAFDNDAQSVAEFLAIKILESNPTPEELDEIERLAAEKDWAFLSELINPNTKG